MATKAEEGWMPWPNDEWHLLEAPSPVSPDPERIPEVKDGGA